MRLNPPGRSARRSSGSTPERIRTSDQRFRKPLLYPAELRGQELSRNILRRTPQVKSHAAVSAVVSNVPVRSSEPELLPLLRCEALDGSVIAPLPGPKEPLAEPCSSLPWLFGIIRRLGCKEAGERLLVPFVSAPRQFRPEPPRAGPPLRHRDHDVRAPSRPCPPRRYGPRRPHIIPDTAFQSDRLMQQDPRLR
jgi:hypothetical protein